MANATSKNTSLPFKIEEGEKVFYRGKFRIVGRIVDDMSRYTNKQETIGYLVMEDKTGMIKSFKIPETKFLISKYGFINAEIVDGTIRCTEGKMDNIMTFDVKLNRLSVPKIMILGEVLQKNGKEEREFKILSADLKVLPKFYTESEILKMVSMPPFSGIASICNAKNAKGNIVANVSITEGTKRDSNDTGFPKILRSEADKFIKEIRKVNEKDDWRKQKHREKLVRLAPTILFRAMHSRDMSSRLLRTHFRPTEYAFHIKDDLKIMTSEIYKNLKFSQKDLAFLKSSLSDLSSIKEGSYQTMEGYIKYISIYQYMLKIPEVRQELLKYGKKKIENNSYIHTYFKNLGNPKYAEYNNSIYFNLIDIIPEYKKLFDELKEYGKVCMYRNKHSEYLKMHNEKMEQQIVDVLKVLPNKKFTTVKEIEELGFAVQEAQKGEKYTTSYGSRYTLKYLGDYIPNYQKYFKMASCFGDLCCLAQVEALHQKGGRNADKLIEIVMGILAIYRPDIAKEYIEDRKKSIPVLNKILPNMTFDTAVDFGLNPELRKYYESGFNAFYMDNAIYTDNKSLLCSARIRNQYEIYYKKYHKEPFINFRCKFASYWPIQHTLFSELIAVLGLITSNECTTDFIEENIGCLRFI